MPTEGEDTARSLAAAAAAAAAAVSAPCLGQLTPKVAQRPERPSIQHPSKRLAPAA
jgi:hypothetical protein